MNERYSAEQAAAPNTTLRAALGLAPQEFTAQDFVGMISEEIEQLRAAGKTDDDIAALLSDGVGVRLDPDLIARYYAGPDERVGYP